MDSKLMKWVLAPIVFLLLSLVSCEKKEPGNEENYNITAAEAVEIVTPILDKYSEEQRFWLISKDPIPANTTLKYGQFGYYDPHSEYCGKFKSPNYKAWLIMIGPDARINGSVYGTVNLFVDVNTGEYEEIRADGQISDIEWDRSFFVTTYNPD
ncbi:MAG: hypothetical protein IK022_07510 [Bacteroidales bacterium]|nr:hypothetical protein [Bacteroidales bacterium]